MLYVSSTHSRALREIRNSQLKSMHNFIQHLQTQLQGPLPGQDAQYRMAPAFRGRQAPAPGQARLAGVLALLYPKDSIWHLALIERVAAVNATDRHGGQISFPGGKYESDDGILLNTALREAQEEIGVVAKDIKMLGALTELYIPVSNFSVHPFVGWLDYVPNFQPQWSEVQAVLEVPFELLQAPATLQTTDVKVGTGMVLKEVPYFNLFGRVVWGATAMILSELLEVALER